MLYLFISTEISLILFLAAQINAFYFSMCIGSIFDDDHQVGMFDPNAPSMGMCEVLIA